MDTLYHEQYLRQMGTMGTEPDALGALKLNMLPPQRDRI
jgi:hypothetical protein